MGIKKILTNSHDGIKKDYLPATDENEYIEVFSCDYPMACILTAYAGTTGLRGGDAGHGCRTYLSFKDSGGTCMMIRTDQEAKWRDVSSIEIGFGGDHELGCVIDALKFMRTILKMQKYQNKEERDE